MIEARPSTTTTGDPDNIFHLNLNIPQA